MLKKFFAVLLVVSLLMATTMTAPTQDACDGICMHRQVVLQVITSSTVTMTVHSHTPNNHNLQELAVTIEKIHEIENSADYLQCLTACSKRSIYVGEADSCRLSERNTL